MLPRFSLGPVRTGVALSVLALGALAFPLLASAAYQSVSLYNKQEFKGYRTEIHASKPARGNADLTINLQKGGQAHSYSFEIARSSFSLNKSLTAGSIKFNAVSPKHASGALAAALGGWGGGTISFVSAGRLKSQSCKNGGKLKMRPVSRNSGSLTFSPSKTNKDMYSRSAWSGSALAVGNADGWCQTGPTTPPKCPKYVSLTSSSGFSASGLFTYLSVQRNNGATKTDVFFSYQPTQASIAPATGVTHGRSARVANSRFTVSGWDSASADLNGVAGFSGTFAFTRDTFFPITTSPGSCPSQSATGTPSGAVAVTFDFAEAPSHTGHDYASLRRAS